MRSFAIDQKLLAVPSNAPNPESQIKASQDEQRYKESSIKEAGPTNSSSRKGALGLSVNYSNLDSSGLLLNTLPLLATLQLPMILIYSALWRIP